MYRTEIMIIVQLIGGEFKFACECDSCKQIINDEAEALYALPMGEGETNPVLHICSKCKENFIAAAYSECLVHSDTLANHLYSLFGSNHA